MIDHVSHSEHHQPHGPWWATTEKGTERHSLGCGPLPTCLGSHAPMRTTGLQSLDHVLVPQCTGPCRHGPRAYLQAKKKYFFLGSLLGFFYVSFTPSSGLHQRLNWGTIPNIVASAWPSSVSQEAFLPNEWTNRQRCHPCTEHMVEPCLEILEPKRNN